MFADGGSSELLEVYEPPFIRDELLEWWNRTRGSRLAVWAMSLAHPPIHRPPSEELPPGYPIFLTSVRARYESMLASADLHLGQVLTDVDLATTLVIVVGDNGTPPDAAPDQRRAKGTTFERGIRVPLVVAGPGVPHGTVSDKLVHIVDLLPTILDF